jgi:hypothetical protein
LKGTISLNFCRRTYLQNQLSYFRECVLETI